MSSTSITNAHSRAGSSGSMPANFVEYLNEALLQHPRAISLTLVVAIGVVDVLREDSSRYSMEER